MAQEEKEKTAIIIQASSHHHHYHDIGNFQVPLAVPGDLVSSLSIPQFRSISSSSCYMVELQEKDEEIDLSLSCESGVSSLHDISSRVLYLLGDVTAAPAYRFTQWLESVRRRCGRYRSSGFPNRPSGLQTMPLSVGAPIAESKSSLHIDQTPEISLWERLGKAAVLDIESSEFSWNMLSSLHHTEHNSSTEHSEDEMSKALEVTVNSGGVVFFALFNRPDNDDSFTKEAAAVIKIASSRMATQSERLGYEFAKWLGVRTPQARVVHNSSPEWQQIKNAAEKAKDVAISENDEIGEMTCSELLEALELSRCLLLMNYIHGSPLLESSNAFDSQESAEKAAAALGRILMLDLVIRNEDRLPCRQLGWRGNSANLLFSDKASSANADALDEVFDSVTHQYRPRVMMALQKERRANSLDIKLSPKNTELISQSSDVSELMDSPRSSNMSIKSPISNEEKISDCRIVAIDSGIPRRPPAGKRANDQVNYPKLVELLLNSAEYSSNLLYEITGGKLGTSLSEEADTQANLCSFDITTVVHEFRSGFRAALRDLQGFHIFLLTLHQKLDNLFRAFLSITNKYSSGDFDKEDIGVAESPIQAVGVGVQCLSPVNKERFGSETHGDLNDMDLQRTAPKTPPLGYKESSDTASPISREGWHGKCKGSGDPIRNFRLTARLRDFNKFAKVDAELNRELEQWNEMLKSDAVKLCQENNFITGFFEGNDTNSVVDAYELKVCDNEDAGISNIFIEASDFIDNVENTGGRVLVHCFEGKSRSATVVLAYLMLRKGFTLSEAWDLLKKAHRRAQPNDGFAKTLLDLERRLYGKVSMEWHPRKPMMKSCPICGKRVGLSSSSLKLHLQKSHRKLSSGSVDSAMTMEIQKALNALKMNRGGSVSPTQKKSHSIMEGYDP